MTMLPKIAEFWEVDGFEDIEGAPGTCDWGDCDEPAVAFRLDDLVVMDMYDPVNLGIGWLPVCERHRTED